MRTCTRCLRELADFEFHIFRTNKSGMKSYYCRMCRDCSNECGQIVATLKERHPPPPVGTPCACCNRIDKLQLDHCHATADLAQTLEGPERDALLDRAFRNFICSRCNTALGNMGDSEEGVMQALRYLQRWRRSMNASVLPQQGN